MDTSAELISVANELEDAARFLLGVDSEPLPPSRRTATTELGRSTAGWMIATRRVARSGAAAWDAHEARFPRDPDDPPLEPAPEFPEGPATRVSELDVISAFITADMTLDDLAWAELVRREQAPTWRHGVDQVPTMWPPFMALLDAEPSDPMTRDARYLDVTLAFARDVLVAHRDPTVHYFPAWSSWGEVRLARHSVEPERQAAALERLQAVNATLQFPWREDDDYRELLDRLVAIAGRLDASQRAGIRAAYRHAGFESPSLADMTRAALKLLRIHTGELKELVSAAA